MMEMGRVVVEYKVERAMLRSSINNVAKISTEVFRCHARSIRRLMRDARVT